MGFGDEGVDAQGDAPQGAGLFALGQHRVLAPLGQADEVLVVGVRLGGQPNHDVELKVGKAGPRHERHLLQNLLLAGGLEDDIPEPVAARLRGQRNGPVAAGLERRQEPL